MKLSALPLPLAINGGILGFLLLAGSVTCVLAMGCSASPSPESAASSSPPATPGSVALQTVPATTVLPTPVSTPSPVPTAVPPREAIPALVGSSAPDFPFKLFQGEEALGGSELNLSDITGQPIVLNFWARFCGPCWSEMPELQDFYEERGHQLRLLGVDVGQFTGLGSPKDAGRLLDALGITYPAGYTDDASVVAKYRIRAMPTTIFIDSQGGVFRSWAGSINRQQLEAIVAEMLDKE